MRTWPTVKIEDLVVPVSRVSAVDRSGEYRLLGVRLNGRGPFLREVKLGSAVSASTLNQVQKGDFIYSRLFAWRGAFGLIDDSLNGCHVSNEFPTFRIKDDRLDAKYFLYWFRLPMTLHAVSLKCTGSTPVTRNRFKEEFLLEMEFHLPPLPEQRRVVAKIEEFAGKIEEAVTLCQQINYDVDSLITSIHYHLSNGQKSEIGSLVYLDEDLANVSPSVSYPQVGVRGFGAGLFPKPALYGSETTYKRFNRLFDGALVLSQVKGWEGAIAVCPPELSGWFVSPEYRTFRCFPDKMRPGYLSLLVSTKWFCNLLTNISRGVGGRRERTRPEQFLALKVLMPPVDLQELGEQLFAKVNIIKQLKLQSVPMLDQLLPAILHEAFQGKF